MATDQDANPVGRPTKYDPAYCGQVIEFMSGGYSLTAFGGEILVARSTLNEWINNHPEFSEAVAIGQAKRTGTLEKTLLQGETGPKVTAHIFALKNADPLGWSEKVVTELSGPNGGPIQSETSMDLSRLTLEQKRALASIQIGE